MARALHSVSPLPAAEANLNRYCCGTGKVRARSRLDATGGGLETVGTPTPRPGRRRGSSRVGSSRGRTMRSFAASWIRFAFVPWSFPARCRDAAGMQRRTSERSSNHQNSLRRGPRPTNRRPRSAVQLQRRCSRGQAYKFTPAASDPRRTRSPSPSRTSRPGPRSTRRPVRSPGRPPKTAGTFANIEIAATDGNSVTPCPSSPSP